MTVEIYGVGKVTASKKVLNEIACAYSYAKDYLQVHGDNYNYGQILEKRMNSIYDELDKTGYYDDVKGRYMR